LFHHAWGLTNEVCVCFLWGGGGVWCGVVFLVEMGGVKKVNRKCLLLDFNTLRKVWSIGKGGRKKFKEKKEYSNDNPFKIGLEERI